MRRWYASLRRLLPHRRRRRWRFVSGHRRRVGWVLFAALLMVAYSYWHLTNDDRVRREVEGYVARLTGGQVRVEAAQFRLFGGVRVSGLYVTLPGGTGQPFFEAPKVRLVHRPWSLLLKGRLEVTEIVCIGPTVRLEEDLASGELNVMKLFPLGGGVETMDAAHLPKVLLQDGKLIRIDLDQLHEEGGPGMEALIVGLLPDAREKVYHLTFDGRLRGRKSPATNTATASASGRAGSRAVSGKGTIDLVSGQTHMEGSLGLEGLDVGLQRRYRQLREEYQLTGEVSWVGEARVGGLPASRGPGRIEKLKVALKNVSMKLPEKMGAVQLTGVTGELVFDRQGIYINGLTGTIAKADGAVVTVSGRYKGYKKESAFDVDLLIKGLSLPFRGEVAGDWGQRYAVLMKRFAPRGPVGVAVRAWRGSGEEQVRYEGAAILAGASFRMPKWPIRVENVRGTVALSSATPGASALDLTGQVGGGTVDITGKITGDVGRFGYDVRADAKGVAFTAELRDALPEKYRKIWKAFSPKGKADYRLRFKREPVADASAARYVDIFLTGDASIEYWRFPYRLDRTEGEIAMYPGGVTIRRIRGKSGPMTCLLSGTVIRRGQHNDVDVTIEEVNDLPLDKRLARALPDASRAALEACRASGVADVTDAKFRRRGGGPVEFTIPVVVRNAGFTHEAFAYPVNHASGEIVLTRGQAHIKHLVGRHGKAKVSLSGDAFLKQGRQVLDLQLDATELSMDDTLRQALPPVARRWWALVKPTGVADVTMTLQTSLAPAPKTQPASRPASRPAGDGTDYHIVFRPRDVGITYRGFPYPLKGVTGVVEIVPGRMRMMGVKGLAGRAMVALEGTVDAAGGGERGLLAVRSGAVAIDETLLKALPAGIVGMLRLKAGGTVKLDLDQLMVRNIQKPTTRPAGGKAAATRPAPKVAWRWAGKMTFRDAVMDLGFGGRDITGTIDGVMGCDGPPQALYAKADVALSNIIVLGRRLTSTTARVNKKADAPTLRIDDLAGKSSGGRVAGFAEYQLTEPTRYGLRLSVEDVSLKDFLSDGQDPAKKLEVSGRLTGMLQMTAMPGDRASRRATGKLHITKAKMYRLPVLLGLLHVVYLSLPSDTAFHTADIDYFLRGDDLVFREIHLQGSAMSMLGAGRMNMKSKRLKLTFLTGTPHKLPRLVGLTEFLQGVSTGLMTVRITGTLEKPKTRTEPFSDVDKALREIFNPGRRR